MQEVSPLLIILALASWLVGVLGVYWVVYIKTKDVLDSLDPSERAKLFETRRQRALRHWNTNKRP